MEDAQLCRQFIHQFGQVSHKCLPTDVDFDLVPDDELIPFACEIFDQFMNDVESAGHLRAMDWLM